jgi:flagellar basal body-associated protein FliL
MDSSSTINIIQLFILCFGIVGFVIPFFLAIWVYNDAMRNEIEIPIVWAFITFALSIFGIIIYLVAKYTQQSQKHIGQTYENIKNNPPKSRSKRHGKRSGPIETY